MDYERDHLHPGMDHEGKVKSPKPIEATLNEANWRSTPPGSRGVVQFWGLLLKQFLELDYRWTLSVVSLRVHRGALFHLFDIADSAHLLGLGLCSVVYSWSESASVSAGQR